MIPDLGKYAVEVLSAYGVSLMLLIAIVWITLWRGRAARTALAQAEEEAKKHG